jgi:hypothetical protein
MTEIDTLVYNLNKSFTLHNTWYNNSPYQLYMQGEQVITNNYIANGANIGKIIGTYKYIWELQEMSPYVIVIDEEYVIDGTATPRSILTMVRNGHYLGLHENIMLKITDDNDGNTIVSFVALRDIMPNEELVY